MASALALTPPVLVRYWKDAPLSGVMTHHGVLGAGVEALADHDARLGPGVGAVRLSTLAVIEPLPLSGL